MKKKISITLMLLAFVLSISLGITVAAAADNAFTDTANWKNNASLGTAQTVDDGISFSSDEGNTFYDDWQDNSSIYFLHTYQNKIVWNEMNYYLRIDEMTSDTGRVALLFNFDTTQPDAPIHYAVNGAHATLGTAKTMLLMVNKGAEAGTYEFRIAHAADNIFRFEEMGTECTKAYEINSEDGIFNFSSASVYDIICNGTRVQAQGNFQPGGNLNITATETSEVYVSVLGFDTTAYNYDDTISVTVSENALSAPAVKLEAPVVTVNETDEGFTFNWEAVPNASSYELYIYDEAGEPVEGYNGVAFTSGDTVAKGDLQEGSYTVRVRAVGDGTEYVNSDLSEAKPFRLGGEATKLDAPSISIVEKAFSYIVNWEAVSNASGYKCYLYNGASAVDGFNGIDFEPGDGIDKADLEAGDYTVKVAAVGDGVNYLDSDLSAAASFTYEVPTGWQQESTTGTRQKTEDGMQFSSDEGTYFYENWKDWYSLYFLYGNADAMTWGDVDMYLRIDELTSATGAVALAFDFARTGVYNPQNVHHGVKETDFDSPAQTMVFGFIKTAKAGVYTFYVAHQSDNGLFKIDANGTFGVKRGEITAADGVIHFEVSADSAFDVKVNGNNYPVQDVFEPGAFNIANPQLTDKVFMSVLGFDYEGEVYDESITCTLLDEAPAPEELGDWRHNGLSGSATEMAENNITVSGSESDEEIQMFNDANPDKQVFPDETDRILYSYTQTSPKPYAGLEVLVSFDEITNKSSKVMIIVNLADSLPEGITSTDGLAIVIVPDEEDGYYNIYVYRILNRIVWEEVRETYDVPCSDGLFSLTFGGNSMMIYANNNEISSDISGLMNLGGNLDTGKNAYVSVVGLDDVTAEKATLTASVTVKEEEEDTYVDDALDAAITGKYEFTSTDWASWEMAGTNVSYTISQDGLRLEGNGGEYGQKQAQSYLYDLSPQITDENGSLKIALKINQFYPYTPQEDADFVIKNTFDIVLGSEYQRNFTDCKSVFMRLVFKSETEGTAGLGYNTGTTADTYKGLSDISFTWDGENVIFYLAKDTEGNYRAYVNGSRFTLSKMQNAEFKAHVDGLPEIFFSTYSTIEIESLDPQNPTEETDTAYTSIYTVHAIDGKKIVNEEVELTNVAAPSKPQDSDIGENNIKISWTVPTLNPYDNGSFTVGGYIVERYDVNAKGSNKDGVPDEVYYITDTQTLSLNVTGLTKATKYFFTIYAVDDATGGDAGRDDMTVLAKYAQFTVTTAGEEEGDNKDPDKKPSKKGCSGSVTFTALSAGIALVGAAAVLFRKNKKD